MTVYYEHITNLKLLKNNLYHIGFELEKGRPSYARIAKEAHLCLNRAMVEALKGSANIAITGTPKSKNREAYYKIGNNPHYKIVKESVNKCKKAWRYSKPIVWPEDQVNYERIDYDPYKFDDFLIGFYDLLAMIQNECYMFRYIHSKPINISDDEMYLLEGLHEQVRNEYEHFIPKSLSLPKYDLMLASHLCLNLSKKLIYDSGNVYNHERGIKTHILKTSKILLKHKAAFEKRYMPKISNKKPYRN